MSHPSSIKKKLRYGIETLLVKSLYILFQLLPIALASSLGGYFAEKIGPGLNRSDVARNNLRRAMPKLDDNHVEKIVSEMWNNIGRTFAEFPHIARMNSENIKSIATLEGSENIVEAASIEKGSIYFTGHLANWEIGPRSFSDLGYPVSIVYRKGNNPGLSNIIRRLRSNYLVSSIPKGQSGSREIIRLLKQGKRIGMLVDQKMNDGIRSSFFGIEAMTAPAIARLALKYKYPILPVRVIRIANCKFKVLVSPPLKINNTGDVEKDVQTIIDEINNIVECWIREYPGQWIWLHNRWPKI
ncbi:MAG: KDO2-lipid IV(A) lauroyltransferase [Gammaproteobacteria bacterium]|jgi:KDO2-lipid IV(A) lauroyltransferase